MFATLMENHHDFPFNCLPLAKYYGLSDFVVIAPAGNEMLTSEDRINLLLSSITIAVGNIQRYRKIEHEKVFYQFNKTFPCPLNLTKKPGSRVYSVTFQITAAISRNI